MPPSRRGLLRLAVTTLAVVASSVATGAALTPANAAADSGRVASGNARFEVLSPTLIRTEYAGDAHFVDASTFNVVGRDDFARTDYTTSTSDGWLTVATSALTLRYKVGSGAFTDKNLVITERAGAQDVTASPWPAPTSCPYDALCEAEDLDLSGVTVGNDHGGYTGTGFAAGWQLQGNSLGFQITVPSAGTYDLDARYANSQGGDGQNTTRTLSVIIDGTNAQTMTLPRTANWDDWERVTVPLTLTAGTHKIALTRTATDSGNVNIDSLAIVPQGDPYPAPTPPAATPCAYGTTCEAETGDLHGGAHPAGDHNGHSGSGFLAGLEHAGDGVTLHVTGVPAAGTYAVQLRYANYLAGAQPLQTRTMTVTADGAAPVTASLPPTSSWDAWRTVSASVPLDAGDNTVALGCPTDQSCNVNVDTVAVTTTSAPLLAPHAPLGGYRRGLDGVDGGALTSPGLLYQDGWSLLDDTASALWNPATHTVSPRPSHGGADYQDGYVFGYGQDYAAGLRDLSVLTGPTELLPRWTYGTWFSEYYDRTQSQFEDQIVPRFRSEGVPLDALIVDTDFKSPNRWNGWEIDPSRFPDPTAFFDWAHQQGLHTSLNVHPSILAADPQYAQAQQTANGGLKTGGCSGGGNDCHVFDWGDPAQLKAYFDLHSAMEQQGVDFWWLDWCCDGSSSSLAGVTPDAWINQQYALDTNKSLGRGFAFSRAYGSLQAGGYSNPGAIPTGPWADKRTTLHFTGDTISDWPTLHFEIGYTPGESVATGEAAVSHDIGGHTQGLQQPGSERGSTKLPDDLYARWVQLGTFQPIDRLHSNHSDRLPWQYGPDAKASAEKFLNLRENLVPYTYTLARQANATGLPIVRPLYLQYPASQEAYAQADNEYLYGSDVLVAPVSTPGSSATTSVWFPPGSSWTDWFTGKTYRGGSTADVSTDLSTMPVFVRSGGIVTTRTGNVTNDEQNPLTDATITVAEGATGSSSLYEDNGTTNDLTHSATTAISYRPDGATRRVEVAPAVGSYTGQVQQRAWTVAFTNATAPKQVIVNGVKAAAGSWTWDAATRTLRVTAPVQSVRSPLTVMYVRD